MESRFLRRLAAQAGETMLSLLVSLALIGVIFAAALNSFLDASQSSMDLQIRARAEEQAKTILDLMAFDIRMTGAGMPLGQSGFAIGGSGLGAAPLPILLTSTATNIALRLNESGSNTILSANYTPSSSSLTFSVASASDFESGDTLYISNMTVGGAAGLQGTVTGTTGTTITINNAYVASASTTFSSGSTVDRVTNVTFDSPNDWRGITRNAELGAVRLAPNSTFSASYRDASGTAIALPLTNTTVSANLASIQLTVSVRGDKTLRDGTIYTATAQETIALRNLNMNR